MSCSAIVPRAGTVSASIAERSLSSINLCVESRHFRTNQFGTSVSFLDTRASCTVFCDTRSHRLCHRKFISTSSDLHQLPLRFRGQRSLSCKQFWLIAGHVTLGRTRRMKSNAKRDSNSIVNRTCTITQSGVGINRECSRFTAMSPATSSSKSPNTRLRVFRESNGSSTDWSSTTRNRQAADAATPPNLTRLPTLTGRLRCSC